jgi:hypothetical protein
MHRLLEQIRTPEFEAAHPALQASYCHYAFVGIHPFADGNGRVARALASTFFYRDRSIPLVIFENQRPAYLDVLRAADLGDFRPVISFFLDRGIDTMQLVAESLSTAEAPKPEDSISRINKPVSGSLSRQEIVDIEGRLANEIAREFEAHANRLKLPSASLDQRDFSSPRSLPEGYAQVGKHTVHEILLYLGPPKSGFAKLSFSIGFKGSSRFPFLIHSNSESDPLEVRLEDISPELTPYFSLRLDNWIQRHLARMLAYLAEQADS